MRKVISVIFMVCILTASIFVSEADDAGMGSGEERSELYRKMYDNGVTYITLYYQDDGGNLIPVTREVPKQEGIARAAVEGLIDSAVTREELKYYGLYPVLPAGTKLRGLVINDGTARIDFNTGIRSYFNEKAERNIIASVVYTLTEFASVKQVSILMDGKPMERLKSGTSLPEFLSRQNTLINSNKIILEEGTAKADIFFWKNYLDRFEYYLPVSVKREKGFTGEVNDKPDGEPVGEVAQAPAVNPDSNIEWYMKSVVLELTNNPSGIKGMEGKYSGGLELLAANLEKDLLTLDFNDQFKIILENAENRKHFVNQILYTAKQIPGALKVRFLVNGKSVVIPEGGDFSRSIRIPSGANQFIDENAGWEATG